MARLLTILSLTSLNFFGVISFGATYTPKTWVLNGGGEFHVISSAQFNAALRDVAPLPGLIGFKLGIERGLVAPKITHWFEVGYHLASFGGTEELTSGAIIDYAHTYKYISIIPIGVNYWWMRTDYIDFSFGGGVGVALSPTFTFSAKTREGTTTPPLTSAPVVPKTTFLLEGRAQMRAWLERHWGVTVNAGLRYYTPGTKMNFFGYVIGAYATYAFGSGVKDTGRSYVEVLPADPEKPNSKSSSDKKSQRR